jgi:hypothetical protein
MSAEWPPRGMPTKFKSAPKEPRVLLIGEKPPLPEELKPRPLVEYGQLQTGMRVNVVVNDELALDEAGHPLVLQVLEAGIPTHNELFPVIKDSADGKTKILPIGFKKPLLGQDVSFSPTEVFTQYTLPKRGTFVSFCNGKLVTYDSATFNSDSETDENEYEPAPAGPVIKITHAHGRRYLNLTPLRRILFSRAKYSDRLVFVKLYEAKELEELVDQSQVNKLLTANAERRHAHKPVAVVKPQGRMPESETVVSHPQKWWMLKKEKWITNPKELVEQAQRETSRFLGTETRIEIPNPPKLLIETLEKLKKEGFHDYHAIYFPAVSLSDSTLYPGLKDQPGNRLYEFVQAGLVTNLLELSGQWAIIDAGERPTAEQAMRSHPDDPLSRIISTARNYGRIRQESVLTNFPLDSRSGISAKEQDEVVFVDMAQGLELQTAVQAGKVTIRRPKYAELVYAGINRYPHLDHVNTREYTQDRFLLPGPAYEHVRDNIVTTGDSTDGGFISGTTDLYQNRMGPVYFRPLIVFNQAA